MGTDRTVGHPGWILSGARHQSLAFVARGKIKVSKGLLASGRRSEVSRAFCKSRHCGSLTGALADNLGRHLAQGGSDSGASGVVLCSTV